MMRVLPAIALLGLGCIPAAAALDESTREGRAVKQALDGRCAEALPELKKAAQTPSSAEAARLVGKAGVRCSMMTGAHTEALVYLAQLQQRFPRDPDVLLLAVRLYTDLANVNSQTLMAVAPDSPEVIQLNAENFETHGDIQKAIAEFRVLLQRTPDAPGIHYRIGGLILSLPPTATSAEEARKEFEAELKIYPQNAGAEYYLGELARQSGNASDAIGHFEKAATLTPDFAEAYLGLGRSLLDAERAAEAIPPLEKAAQLAPDNPAPHLALATAYQRAGRKEDAAREFALQKSTSDRMNQNTKTLRKNVSGAPGTDPK